MEYNKVLALAFLLSCAIGDTVAGEISLRLSGGTKVESNKEEFGKVLMVHGNGFSCTAYAVSETAIITAASCFDSQDGNFDSISIMEHTRTNVIVHEDYNKDLPGNNIAIITIESMGFEDNIILASEDTKSGTNCRVTGYGETGDDGSTLMTAYYENVTVMGCTNKETPYICAGVTDDNNNYHGIVCTGDIGAPLVCNNQLVGIAVRGNSCGSETDPDEYQKIKDVKDWIETHIYNLSTSSTDSTAMDTTASANLLIFNYFVFLLTLKVIF
ncbi:hypothetical protein L9F63_020594 [Diploptera punctata]|uniref:Peptidase S1 domain-containing protein n=1 Tax=Diploptera punctata TaxID=6984 RepID=A0AAD7ZR49_DIPPU|nr:hypothetical protein L9F63_020594 [Diploptera punctata]